MIYVKIEITDLYQLLAKEFGKQYWWPMDDLYHKKNGSDPRFEIIIGAILTQNTAWSNVEKALNNLKKNKMLSIKKIVSINDTALQQLIKPSGFFKQKSARLKNIAEYIKKEYNSDLNSFFNRETLDLREELLSINGIGPETADSILLYAGNKPIFVVDAYTKRICKRIPLIYTDNYKEIQRYFQEKLENDYSKTEISDVYNELHALIVELGKNFCKKNKPLCKKCPLNNACNFAKIK